MYGVVFVLILPLFFIFVSWNVFVCVSIYICVLAVFFVFVPFGTTGWKEKNAYVCLQDGRNSRFAICSSFSIFQYFFFVICVVFFVAVLSCLGTVLEWESFICAQCWSIVISWSLILDHTVCILGPILNFYLKRLYFGACKLKKSAKKNTDYKMLKYAVNICLISFFVIHLINAETLKQNRRVKRLGAGGRNSTNKFKKGELF